MCSHQSSSIAIAVENAKEEQCFVGRCQMKESGSSKMGPLASVAGPIANFCSLNGMYADHQNL
jgi:hypothetical protein